MLQNYILDIEFGAGALNILMSKRVILYQTVHVYVYFL